MTTATTEHQEQAQKFLDDFGFKFSATMHPDGACPPWRKPCDHVHGDQYRVTIRRRDGGKSISFNFWNSYADIYTLDSKGLDAYDVLAAISSDASAPTDPDEVAEEFGEMRPSQAIAVARFARRLQAFFTEAELEALAEIQ